MKKNQTQKPAYRFMIKAVSTNFSRVVHTDDYSLGEAWIHVMARGLKAVASPDDTIVITMFDVTVDQGPNIIAQYEKLKGQEGFKSFVPDTFMLYPAARKEIYYE